MARRCSGSVLIDLIIRLMTSANSISGVEVGAILRLCDAAISLPPDISARSTELLTSPISHVPSSSTFGGSRRERALGSCLLAVQDVT